MRKVKTYIQKKIGKRKSENENRILIIFLLLRNGTIQVPLPLPLFCITFCHDFGQHPPLNGYVLIECSH